MHGYLYAYFLRRFNCGDQDAEDLAADVLVRVHNAVATFNPDGGAKLTTWIIRIARNLGIDWYRKQKRLAERSLAAVPLDDTNEKKFVREQVNDWFRDTMVSHSPSETDDLPANIQCMSRARAALSPDDQNLLELRLTMSNREIADAEHVNEGVIRTRHSRAVGRLKAAFEKEKNPCTKTSS